MLSSDPVPYPCVYASKGFKASEHQYLFLNSEDPRNEDNLVCLASALGQYLSTNKKLGFNTSFVVLFPRSETRKTVQQYYETYWLWLNALARMDKQPWPENVPRQLDHPKWRFCFQGIGLFSVCLTPAHELRRSRSCACFSIVFQPESVLHNLFSTPQKKQGAMSKVRNLLKDYDSVSISPDLKEYGDDTGRESQQYFLMDENAPTYNPFNYLGAGFA